MGRRAVQRARRLRGQAVGQPGNELSDRGRRGFGLRAGSCLGARGLSVATGGEQERQRDRKRDGGGEQQRGERTSRESALARCWLSGRDPQRGAIVEAEADKRGAEQGLDAVHADSEPDRDLSVGTPRTHLGDDASLRF